MDEARIAELLEPFLSEVGRRTGGSGGQSSQFCPCQAATYIDIHRYIAALECSNQPHRGARTGRNCDTPLWRIHFRRPATSFPRPGTSVQQRSRRRSHAHRCWLRAPASRGCRSRYGLPQVHLTLIESNHKKGDLPAGGGTKPDLRSVDVFAGRAETFPGGKGGRG